MVGGSGGFDYIIMLSFSYYSINLLFNCYIVIFVTLYHNCFRCHCFGCFRPGLNVKVISLMNKICTEGMSNNLNNSIYMDINK